MLGSEALSSQVTILLGRVAASAEMYYLPNDSFNFITASIDLLCGLYCPYLVNRHVSGYAAAVMSQRLRWRIDPANSLFA